MLYNAGPIRKKIMLKTKWQKETSYNNKSLIEITMMRYKKLVGEKLFNRKFINQKIESALGSLMLNRMLDLGKPISVRV